MMQDVPPGIIEYLKKDPVKNSNILCFIEDNIITGYQSCGNSILISGLSDREWIYFSSSDITEFKALLKSIIPGSYNFTVTEDWMEPLLLNLFPCRRELNVNKYYFPAGLNLPELHNKIFTLTDTDADKVLEFSEYKDYLSLPYITDRIKRGISGGIYNGDELIGWAITHDDGAIGFLHIEERYRGKGLGTDLTIYMIGKVRQAGRIPFVHIEASNQNSISLAKKLGFRESGKVSWLVKTE
jgi:8-oxo-dGTP diphosphatase